MNVSAPHFRLLVFDWDGTVMDSAGSIVACMRTSLEDLGYESPGDDRLRSTIGLGLGSVLQELMPRSTPEIQNQVVERYRHHWLATYHAKPILFEGVRQALEELHRRGFLMAVATGKGRAGLDRDLDGCGLRQLFLTTRTVNECASKPAPQMLLEIMDELGCRPGETLVIGDTTYDLDMARNAGVMSVGVLCGAHPGDTLDTCDPLACLTMTHELPGWLDDQGCGNPKQNQ